MIVYILCVRSVRIVCFLEIVLLSGLNSGIPWKKWMRSVEINFLKAKLLIDLGPLVVFFA